MNIIDYYNLNRKLKAHREWINTGGERGRRAALRDANLRDAVLSGANLTQVKNLSINQLYLVKTLYEAELDLELMEQVKERYPHLLEEPKEEEE